MCACITRLAQQTSYGVGIAPATTFGHGEWCCLSRMNWEQDKGIWNYRISWSWESNLGDGYVRMCWTVEIERCDTTRVPGTPCSLGGILLFDAMHDSGQEMRSE